MGDVGLKTRSMLMKRSGRPRSLMSSTGEMPAPATPSAAARRASGALPVNRAPAAIGPHAPARPPTKK